MSGTMPNTSADEFCVDENDKMIKPSANQKRFVKDALAQGHEVYAYSGRYMFGRSCPAINVENSSSFNTKARTCQDSMGRSIVIYAKD